MPVEIPDPPEGWTVADPAAVERARTDGGLRASIARSLWREGKQPSTNAQIAGYVYEIADKAASVIERRTRPRIVCPVCERDVVKRDDGKPMVHYALNNDPAFTCDGQMFSRCRGGCKCRRHREA